ncbi:MAG: hypothetical protein M9890_14675 [Thermomicrobiales bacterium]|nr:hypothetical protein [Thermomicrobiales bacterium]
MGIRRLASPAVLASITVALCIVGMTVVGFAAAHRGNVAEASETFGVYLQPLEATTFNDAQVADIEQVAGGRQFAMVTYESALEATVTDEHPQSIWLHRSALSAVSPAWLREQLDTGTVIVGIDMTRGELANVLRVDGGSTPDWNPPDASTFVIVGKVSAVPRTNAAGETTTHGGSTIVNDMFDPQDPTYLVAMVDRVIEDVRDMGGSSTPSTSR